MAKVKFNREALMKSRREINPNELLGYFRAHGAKFWSWGANGFTNFNNKFLAFRVRGHHHKGYVYVSCNGLDLMDVHLVSTHGNLVKEFENIFIGDLFTVIDDAVERIPEYIR